MGSAASTPFQQLGAAPGTADAVPGLEGLGPEEDEGLEFASSGEAAEAPRYGIEREEVDPNDDYDTELSPELVDYLTQADTAAREAANVLLVGLDEESGRVK